MPTGKGGSMRYVHFVVSAIGAFALVAGCAHKNASNENGATPHAGQAAFALGSHTRPATTSSPEAKKCFDQGLIWAYSFNHDEAIRSFTEATKHDPEFAMAWWGIALCNGPHINFPMMTEDQSKNAWEALAKARASMYRTSPVERALIEALGARYASPAPADRVPLDKAYAEAMKRVFIAYPDDADVAVLYAESLMDLLPWDLYALDGTPREQTPEVLRALERAMELDPNHPGANHLYIHACEASAHPEKADAAATRLRTLVPGSGHMVHMPSHIDVRLGRWNLAVEQNAKASAVDAAYRKLSPNQGFYRLYMAHDDHFKSWASMMAGREADALKAARKMIADVPEEFAKANAPFVDPYMNIEIECLMRFGRWDEILTLKKPAEYFPVTTLFWHNARATAFAVKGDMKAAEAEQETFTKGIAALPTGTMMTLNTAATVLGIAADTLAGEIAYLKGDAVTAIELLRKAAATEDQLRYMEPPDWLRPVRHTLGAVQLDSGRTADAIATYRDDLNRLPENGWSLLGLANALEASGDASGAKDTRARLAKSWLAADTKPHATCLCIPKKHAKK